MFLKLLLFAVFLVAVALAGLGVSVLMKRRGRFPETHISRNEEMRIRGIGCARETDIGCCSSGGKTCCSSCCSD